MTKPCIWILSLFIGLLPFIAAGIFTGENISNNWFFKGLFKKTLTMLVVIVISRFILSFVKFLGLIIGAKVVGWSIFVWDSVALMFEAVAIIAVVSTDDFSDALDMAAKITKDIFIKIAIISTVFMLLQLVLFPLYNNTEANVKEVGNSEEESIEEAYGLLMSNQIDETVANGNEEIAIGIFYGLFGSISNAVVLALCAHNSIEVKQMKDAALYRLNNM